MKILKKAEQKNVTLNNDYYTANDINNMLATKEICYFGEGMKQCYDFVSSWDWNEKEYRLFTDNLNELKVALDEYNYYTTVAVGKNGKTYFVNI